MFKLGCCSCFSCLDFFYNFITNPIIGYCIGFLVSVYLVYLQFEKSTAAFRLYNVILATKEIIEKLQDENDSYTGTLQNKYRYSLGVIIDWCASTFGTGKIEKVEGHYPPVVDINADRWEKFNLYVRPVIEDFNSFSFLGWLLWGKKMRQLRTLVTFCNSIESVVAELDLIVQIDKNNNTQIVKAQDPGLVIDVSNTKYKREIEKLLSKYGQMEIAWKRWIKLIGE